MLPDLEVSRHEPRAGLGRCSPQEKASRGWPASPPHGDTSTTSQFTSQETTRRVRVHGPLLLNNSELLRDAVMQGVGVALLPDFVVAEA